MRVTVDADHAGTRLDVFVASQLPELSRAYIQKLCTSGKITVNDTENKVGHKLREGDKVAVDYSPVDAAAIPHIDVPILYEDDDCVVMNKPVGLLTHALGVHGAEPSVASFLRSKTGLDGERAGIVHRLDRATSGVIIGAKNQKALSWLQKQFAQRKTKKTYVAIVRGELSLPEAVIDMPIERNPKAPATFRVGVNGKSSVTAYKVLEQGEQYALVELRPETGRTHQLRVHLAHIGHPIVGDPLYSNGKHGDRLFLHAQKLEITLPNRERKVFTAPLPAEFRKAL